MKNAAFLIILTISSFYACERSYERTIKGVITHKATGKPMEGVKVLLQDGLVTSDPILGSGNTAPQNFDSTYTDVNGRYEVQVKTKSNHGFIYIFKDGYLHAAESVQMVGFSGKSNTQEINLEMNGRAYFNSYLQKTSGVSSDSDSLILILYRLDSDVENQYNTDLYIGKGPFKYLKDYVPSEGGYEVIGDRYHKYKLKFTTNGVWHTKTDSIFIPTSNEVFTDTIYY